MKFLEGKASELSVGQFLLYVMLAAAAALIVFSLVKWATTTKELVVTPAGSTYIKTSLGGPMSSADRAEYAAAKDKAVATKDAAAAKKA